MTADAKEYSTVVPAKGQNLGDLACTYITEQLNAAISARGSASLMVSGGSSPKPLFAALAQQDIPWDRVTISLVDERWVAPGLPGSNESFLYEHFLLGKAVKAKFISLKSKHNTVEEGLHEIEARFSDVSSPFDICVLGMGLDGHTASWFPNSKGRETAMAADSNARFAYVDAAGCAGAGAFTDRITLTLNAVMDSRSIVLFIPGAPKSDVFDAASLDDIPSAPVAALKLAGKRLTVFTA